MSTAAYLVSYFLSVLGNSVAAIALPLVILTATGSAIGAGIVAASTAVPALLAGLFMGVVIDRVNRRTASIATDAVSAAAVGALPLIDLFTELGIGVFVLFGALGALGDIPGQTARETLVPAIVRSGSWSAERLIGLRESLGAVGLVVGPGIAGVLVALLDGSSVLWVTAGLSLLASAVTLLIPKHLGALTSTPAARVSGWRSLREGWSTMVRSPSLLLIIAMAFVATLVVSSFQGLILPVYFTRAGQEPLLGLVLSALAVGLLLGSGVYAVFSRPGRGRRGWLAAGLVGASVGFGVIASLASVPVMVAGALIGGIACGLFTSLMGVLMLERIPDHVRGRVLGTENAAMTVAPPLGVMIAAALTETVSLGVAAIVAAAFWATMTVAALVARPLRDLGASHPVGPA